MRVTVRRLLQALCLTAYATALPLVAMAQDCVVILHGIARTSSSMISTERYLADAGYKVTSLTYASREGDLSTIVSQLEPTLSKLSRECSGQFHFVTHSMGGLVARAYIHAHRPSNLGRVVMMAPPSQGSEVADFVMDNPLYKSFFGPAGQQLGTVRDTSLTALLGAVDYPVGVIAGKQSINLVSSWFLLPGEDDGKVTVERARLPGMADFVILTTTPATMMFNAESKKQTLAFLKQGRFLKEGENLPAH